MKINEIKMNTNNYTAYVLDDSARTSLLAKFPPKYPKVIAHHVTVQFGVPADTEVPPPARVKVIGYADSGDGLEALVCTVDGKAERPDGKRFHITLSLDPSKYSAVDSNKLLASNKFTLTLGTQVATTPALLK
jgi:hypothetical protein